MIKTYISILLIVLLAGARAVQAQESMDDVLSKMDAADQAMVGEAMADGASDDEALDTLFAKGKEYYRSGDYKKAMHVFNAMLAIDKYNNKAAQYKQNTARRMEAQEAKNLAATRAEAMANVKSQWSEEQKVDASIAVDAEPAGPSAEEIAIERLTAQLKDIVIPSLDFRDANIKDVVLFLTESTRRDANGKGVNILLLGMASDDEMGAANNITISIRDMSLHDSLQYIVEMANLKFEVKPSVVAISPVNWVAVEDMVMKSYDIMPEVGEALKSAGGGDSGGGIDDLFGEASSSDTGSGPVDVAGFFSIVDFPEGASAEYKPRFTKLFVKNTPKNLKLVESILADLEDTEIKKRSQQVLIEAKFVEFNEGALEEIGFDWTLYDDGEFAGFGLESDGTYYERATNPSQAEDATSYAEIVNPYDADGPGQSLLGTAQRSNDGVFSTVTSGVLSSMGGNPAAMVFSNNGSFPLDLRITAMQQEGTADVLSAPKVTTKSGNEALIRIVELHRFPQDWDVETGQRTAPVVKPQDWEDIDLGVVLKVTPIVDAENDTIDLELNPEITKFLGYDSYIVGYNSYDAGTSSSFVQGGDGSTLFAEMPYFEKRTVQTQVTIADGSTVLMGGLVDESTETFSDSVPFLGDIPYLGRLFRTEGSRTAKKNLVIYVKATQVDAKGMTTADRELARQVDAD